MCGFYDPDVTFLIQYPPVVISFPAHFGCRLNSPGAAALGVLHHHMLEPSTPDCLCAAQSSLMVHAPVRARQWTLVQNRVKCTVSLFYSMTHYSSSGRSVLRQYMFTQPSTHAGLCAACLAWGPVSVHKPPFRSQTWISVPAGVHMRGQRSTRQTLKAALGGVLCTTTWALELSASAGLCAARLARTLVVVHNQTSRAQKPTFVQDRVYIRCQCFHRSVHQALTAALGGVLCTMTRLCEPEPADARAALHAASTALRVHAWSTSHLSGLISASRMPSRG